MQYFDSILPSTLFLETSNCYINLEGRFRTTNKILDPIGFSYTDTEILMFYYMFPVNIFLIIFRLSPSLTS